MLSLLWVVVIIALGNHVVLVVRNFFDRNHTDDRNDLCKHPFWQPHNPSTPQNLPPQPVFDALVRFVVTIIVVVVDAASCCIDDVVVVEIVICTSE